MTYYPWYTLARPPVDEYKTTQVYHARYGNHLSTLRTLLGDPTVDVNWRIPGGRFNGYSFLQMAIAMERVECVEILLAHKDIRVMQQQHDHLTLLMLLLRSDSDRAEKIRRMIHDYLSRA